MTMLPSLAPASGASESLTRRLTVSSALDDIRPRPCTWHVPEVIRRTRRESCLTERNAREYRGSAVRRAGDFERAAELFDALAHSAQAAARDEGVGAAPVVDDPNLELAAVFLQRDSHVRCVGVGEHVGHRFLNAAK